MAEYWTTDNLPETEDYQYIILIWQGDSGFFYVGKTNNPARRLPELQHQHGNPPQLRMRYRGVTDMVAAKAALMEKMREHFAEQPERGEGWFRGGVEEIFRGVAANFR